jgi:hypothetical protein
MNEYISIIATFLAILTGWVALIVYRLDKRSKRRDAAIILLADIRKAEAAIYAILERGVFDRTMKPILKIDSWSQYKHLFVQEFSSDDIIAFDRFFSSCIEMEVQRETLVQIFISNLVAKVNATQERLLSMWMDDCEKYKEEKRALIIKWADEEDYVFNPGEPVTHWLHALQTSGKISGRSGFEVLRRIAHE